MKRIARIFASAVIATMALCSCSNMVQVSLEPDANAYWKGKTHSEIVQTYGAPDREASDGAGGMIIIYEQTETTVNTYSNGPVYDGFYGFYYHMAGPTSTEVSTEINYAHFYIGKDGICYKVCTNLTKEVDKKEFNEKYK